METNNARITDTFIGVEDHGILTFLIALEVDEGWCVSFGGYDCSGEFLSESIRQILATLEVDSWEKLKGQYVRVVCNESSVDRIGHIMKSKWYNIRVHAKQRHDKNCGIKETEDETE